MSNKHPHYDTIIAWAEGKTIQLRAADDFCWYDWTLDGVAPLFCRDNEYRVKPETIRYRTYLVKTISTTPSGDGRLYVWNVTEADNEKEPREKWPQFVRWLGDWQEVVI